MVINNFKRLRGKIAAVLVIVFCLSLVSIPEVLINAQETKQEAQMRVEILSPRVNEDGTITFSVKYEGDTLYLAGDMTSWESGQESMTKGDDGVFRYTTEVPLAPGRYQYKYKPNSNNWEGSFTQEYSPDGNSILVIKALGVTKNDDNTVTFRVKYDSEELYIAGTMNGWNPTARPMTKGTDGVFEVTLELGVGIHQYKYVTGDTWFKDPNNPNETAEGNSVVEIKGSLQSPVINGDGTVTFRVNHDSEQVKLAGSMTNWASNAITMQKSKDGSFYTTLALEPGQVYEYKFFDENNNWFTDPSNENTSNGNSVVTVPTYTIEQGTDGKYKITINTKYDGDELYLIGSFPQVDWNVSKEVKMTKGENGIFSTTLEVPEGKYVYKFKPHSGNDWSDAFLDSGNQVISDGNSAIYVGEESKVENKYVEFKYVKPDKDFEDWNIWMWSAGFDGMQKNFSSFDGDTATARFLVPEGASTISFIIRKGEWVEKDPFGSDRNITLDPKSNITKVTVASGEKDYFQVPSIENAEVNINDKSILFRYRDRNLYFNNAQDQIESVKVKVEDENGNSNLYDMPYDSTNQYFEYRLNNIQEGRYEYTFIVDGEEAKSGVVDLKLYYINGVAEVSPKEVDYDQNTVVKVTLDEDVSKDNIKEIYMDLSEVGGSNKVPMDLALLNNNVISQTIGVKDVVTSGDKSITIVVVDKNGQEHEIETTLTVKSKTAIGDEDFGFDEARIYFTVTDRFFNGDESNDDPNGNNYDKSNPFTYHGGDLKGLTEKIPYLKDLGINTIWITPIVENTDFNQQFSSDGNQYSYHGYWAKNFENLDPHLGTMDDLKTLIDTAHDSDIKLMVDVVLNHAGYGMNKEEGNSGANNYPTNEDRRLFGNMFRDVAGNDFETQEVSGLPDFRTEDSEVRETLVNWQKSWIEKSKTNKGNTIDYFRIDTVKHVEGATWKSLKNSVTEIDPNFKMIGEYYGADVDSTFNKLENGEMDALLDFQYKNKARDFVNGKITETTDYLNSRADKISNTYLLGQFLSSHDEDGFLTTVDYNLGKQMIGAAIQITDKGIPVIYYGEELGMTGKNGMELGDANRYDMDFSRLEDPEYAKVYNHYKKLLNIRKDNSLVFSKGDRVTIDGGDEDKFSAFSRTYKGESVVTVLNIDEVEQERSIYVPYEAGTVLVDPYNNKEYTVNENGVVNVVIPAMIEGGTVILTTKKTSSDSDNGNINNGVNKDESGDTVKTGDSLKMEGVIFLAALMVTSLGAITIIKNKKKVAK